MEVNPLIHVTFKFGGFWTIVKGTERRKYIGGKQKTVKMIRDMFSWNILVNQIEGICPWLRGSSYELYHYIHGTSPKEYKTMVSENDCYELLQQIGNFNRTEIIIALDNMPEDEQTPNIRQPNQVEPSTAIVEASNMSIGTCFEDSIRFKDFLRSKSITENFGLKITASDRKRVIVVFIDKRECSCRYWQISGLPCIHAVAFIGTKEHPLWHIYVDEYYYTIRYQMAYDEPISTMPGKEEWDTSLDDTVVGPPNSLRPRGRPRKSRYKSFLEKSTTKLARVHKCSRCGAWGHHKNTCKNPINHPTKGSQGNLRQKLPIRRESQ